MTDTSSPASDTALVERLMKLAKVGFGYDLKHADKADLRDAAARLTAMQAELTEAKSGLAELDQVFDALWAADKRAIRMWQEETGKDHIWPDRAKMTFWLLEKLDRVEATIARAGEPEEQAAKDVAEVMAKHGPAIENAVRSALASPSDREAGAVTDEMVEAACKVHAPQWDGMDTIIRVYARQQMRAALTAALALSAPGIVQVPVEPTEAMIDAFYGATEITREGSIRSFAAGWAAMLAASPTRTKGADQ